MMNLFDNDNNILHKMHFYAQRLCHIRLGCVPQLATAG